MSDERSLVRQSSSVPATEWALELAGEVDEPPLAQVAAEVVQRFAEGAASADEVPALAELREGLRRGLPMSSLETVLRRLVHDGYMRGAIVQLAVSLERSHRADVALALCRELMDAVDPMLGVRVARAVLGLADVESLRLRPGSDYVTANRLIGECLLERDDPQGALRHFEAVLAIDVDDPRALRGWSEASRALERRGLQVEHRSRGLALLDGLDELELGGSFGTERYEVTRPLGRGRHAVVYQAYDRHVGRDVAIKRLLEPEARAGNLPARVLERRFFSEARTLARVRSPFVVALLDVQPKHRFIALELCRGGNLRLAMRRTLVGPADLPRVAEQLRAALEAVHAAGAVHRDVKPANILVRTARQGSPVALADFGLAVGRDPHEMAGRAGTLRYLAPELRSPGDSTGASAGQAPSPSSDLWSAGVVLLELARYPTALPDEFDRPGGDLDATVFVPPDLPSPWTERLRSLLSPDPESRRWM